MIILDFFITSLIVVLIPGTGVVFCVSTGLLQGRRASVHAALGCTLGIVPHLLASALGLAALMHASALAFELVKYAGVAYLFYLAYATWNDRAALAVDRASADREPMAIVARAVLLNLLNPKLTIFFLAFLPQFIDAGAASAGRQLFTLSAAFMVMTFVVFIAYGLLANAFRTRVIESPRVQAWLRRTFAAAFAGLGVQLALAER